MTVFTIIFNNYGRFTPQWLDNLAKQTVKPKKRIWLKRKYNRDRNK